MRKFAIVMGSLALVLALATTAHARLQEGQKELSFFGAFYNLSAAGFDASVIIAQVSGGLMLDQAAQVGGAVTAQITSSGGFDSTSIGLQGFYRYHLSPDQEIVPYVEGHGGLAIGDDSTELSLGGAVGVKRFISENLSVNGEGSLTLTLGDIGFTILALQVGMSYYF
jgi:hypothetical protein